MKAHSIFVLFSAMCVILFISSPLQAEKSGHFGSSEDELLKLRINSEIEFAKKLCELHPAESENWLKLIEKAKQLIEKTGATSQDYYHEVVQPAERILTPIANVAKTYTIHCVGHAHIDMNWMWSWPETVAMTNDTFTTVLKLMDEFPEFYFTQSQASVYAIVKEHNPALFEKIKQRVAEGRWEIVAAEWVEGDKNIVSGESLARHQLYTRDFMKDNFNLSPEDVGVCWNPDTFGHAYTIPTILSKAAVKRYYFCRGGGGHKNKDILPSVFWWQGSDGSKLLAAYGKTWYNTRISPKDTKSLLKFVKETGLKDWMNVYGVGDHGGGPTRRDIKRCLEMDSWPIYPNVKMTTAKRYFDIVEKQGDKLPVVNQELNFEFTGCYTSQSQIKQMNRLAECYLQDSESAAVLTDKLIGRSWPVENLKQAWIKTLFGHFHDILPGSGVRWTRQYQSGLFQQASATANSIMTNSLRSLAKKVDTSFAGMGKEEQGPGKLNLEAMGAGIGKGVEFGRVSSATHADNARAVLVFNPTMHRRNEIIKTTVWDPTENYDDIEKIEFSIVDSQGNIVKAQKTNPGKYWGHNFVDLIFPAAVESLGYSTYVIKQENSSIQKDQVETFGSLGFENQYVKVDFDPKTGGINSFVDKKTNHDLADKAEPLAALEYILEKPGHMSAWVIHEPKKRISPLELVSIERKQKGPYLATVEAKMKINDSTISLTYSLSSNQKQLGIELDVNWLERGHHDFGTPTLRIQFPFVLDDAKARYEIPFGSIARSLNNAEEVPSINWANVTGAINDPNQIAGCTLLNDSKHGHSLDDSTLRLTLIRSSYAPDPLPEMGQHRMRLALAPHAGQISASDLIKLGKSFNHPLQVVNTDLHKGSLPAKTASVISVEQDNVLLETIKKAENGSDVVIRLLETAGKKTSAKVKINNSLLGDIKLVAQTDLLERPIASAIEMTADSFSVEIPANGLVTVMVKFAK